LAATFDPEKAPPRKSNKRTHAYLDYKKLKRHAPRKFRIPLALIAKSAFCTPFSLQQRRIPAPSDLHARKRNVPVDRRMRNSVAELDNSSSIIVHQCI
jgi:hypothetical protein